MDMLSRIVVLAADTARSQAYLQAFARCDLRPHAVILYAPRQRSVEVSARPAQQAAIVLPDLSEPATTTCQRAGWTTVRCADTSINAPALREVLRSYAPSLIVFSGTGGEIVGADLLNIGAPFLHVHAGWLPDYRGSTTIYYSILERQICAASAFFLATGIDTGPILTRREYPPPPAGMEVDRLYDSAIRADLLMRTLAAMSQQPISMLPQRGDEGRIYYVIHPVLKHLALLSLATSSVATSAGRDTYHAA
ncbi:MAG TPA: formyltransferase family protein [Burkholderiales bacterium]|nr:formyltransferase family protein [Burkholderiales bacterium]